MAGSRRARGERPRPEGPFTIIYDAQIAGLATAGASAGEVLAYLMLSRFADMEGSCYLSTAHAEKVTGKRRQSTESALRQLTAKAFRTLDGKEVPVLTKLESGRHGRCATYRDNLLLYAARDMVSLPYMGKPDKQAAGDMVSLHAREMDSRPAREMNPLHPSNSFSSLQDLYTHDSEVYRTAGAGALGSEPPSAAPTGGATACDLSGHDDAQLLEALRELSNNPTLSFNRRLRERLEALENHLRPRVGNEAVDEAMGIFSPPPLAKRGEGAQTQPEASPSKPSEGPPP